MGKQTVKAYLHSTRESMYDKGESIGLTGEALEKFSYALYEVAFDLEVADDGSAEIVQVNGRKLEPKSV